jgi:hypothetical protein
VNAVYEVTLGPVAVRTFLSLGARARLLAEALLTELANGPNADKEVELKFDPDGNCEFLTSPAAHVGDTYTATPLSFDAYTALHRQMDQYELWRLAREQGRPVADRGFYVLDILPPESGYSPGTRQL